MCLQMFEWISHNRDLFLVNYTEIGTCHRMAVELESEHCQFATSAEVSGILLCIFCRRHDDNKKNSNDDNNYNGRYAMPKKKKKEEKKGKADLTTVLHIRELPHLHMKLAVWFSFPTTNNKNPMIPS